MSPVGKNHEVKERQGASDALRFRGHISIGGRDVVAIVGEMTVVGGPRVALGYCGADEGVHHVVQHCHVC